MTGFDSSREFDVSLAIILLYCTITSEKLHQAGLNLILYVHNMHMRKEAIRGDTGDSSVGLHTQI